MELNGNFHICMHYWISGLTKCICKG